MQHTRWYRLGWVFTSKCWWDVGTPVRKIRIFRCPSPHVQFKPCDFIENNRRSLDFLSFSRLPFPRTSRMSFIMDAPKNTQCSFARRNKKNHTCIYFYKKLSPYSSAFCWYPKGNKCHNRHRYYKSRMIRIWMRRLFSWNEYMQCIIRMNHMCTTICTNSIGYLFIKKSRRKK